MTSAKQQAQVCCGPTEIIALGRRAMDGAAAVAQRFTLHDVRVV